MEDNKVYGLAEVRNWAQAEVDRVGPDYIYDRKEEFGCLYVHGRQQGEDVPCPGCLIGHMLIKNTPITLEFMKKFDGGGIVVGGIQSVVPSLPVKFTDQAVTFMQSLQYHQDDFFPWMRALELADLEVIETARLYDRHEMRINEFVFVTHKNV